MFTSVQGWGYREPLIDYFVHTRRVVVGRDGIEPNRFRPSVRYPAVCGRWKPRLLTVRASRRLIVVHSDEWNRCSWRRS